jgi:NACHT domain
MDLGLEDCPELLGLQWQAAGQSRQILPKGTRLFDRLADLGGGGTLLVLGEPGAGKTTLLMELATDWLRCTDARREDHAIPVMLNLSSWGTHRLRERKTLTLADWLVEELYQHYKLSSQVGKDWLEKGGFVLLLDGLDEVRESLRNECVAAISQFRQRYGTMEIAVCSRIADYEKLTTTLDHFQAAVFIQPLDEKQIGDYLQQAGKPLQQVKVALKQDPTLLEFARTPLLLWILSLAYRGQSADELLNLPQSERLQRLFDRYIEQMFLKRPLAKGDRQKIIRWLSILAQKMGSEKEFLIERMQPLDWLAKTKHRWLYRLIVGLISGLLSGLLSGLIFGLAVGLAVGLIYGLLSGLLSGLILGRTGGLIVEWTGGRTGGLIEGLDIIEPVEVFEISISSGARQEIFRQLKQGLISGLILGLIVGLIRRLIFGLIAELIFGLIAGLIFGLIAGLIRGLKADIQTRTRPNQGTWNSLQNMIFLCGITLVVTLIFYPSLAHFLPMVVNERVAKPVISLFVSFPIWLTFDFGGGLACIQHFSLRLVLYHTHQIPWDFVAFFKQAEERLFIQRAGGSYRFIHRYLQEHFVSLAPRN